MNGDTTPAQEPGEGKMGLTLPVDVTDAFDHLLLVGLASILEDDGDGPCTLQWNDRWSATLRMPDGITAEKAAETVGRHARRWAESPWLQSEGDYTAVDALSVGKTKHATLSPRLSNLSESYGWTSLQHDRQVAIDALQTIGDRRYIGALGEPSYWSGRNPSGKKELRSDSGASRWEMVTRNKGQEFIGGRLLPLAKTVAGFDSNRLKGGLLGTETKDEQGGNKSDSRTGTGLHRPQVTDNVRAWCALMGVTAFPHMVTTAGRNRDATACLSQMSKERRFAILPVFDGEWTLAKYRYVVRSKELLTYAVSLVESGALGYGLVDAAPVRPQTTWFAEQGIVGCVLFQQYMSDNASAPERYLERGRLFPTVRMQ